LDKEDNKEKIFKKGATKMKLVSKNLNKVTYVIYAIGMVLLLTADANSKICLGYSLLLMTYSLVAEYYSFNVWIAENALRTYKKD
jgi:hypothetical protein